MEKNKKILISMIMIFMLIFLGIFIQEVQATEKQYQYLSDMKYVSNQSSVGWGSITLDKNLDTKYNGGLITLIVDGQPKKFLKGIAAHATSTVVYDITDYDYDFFTAYIGVDASRGSAGNGVKFLIYTSVDGENWDLKTPASPKAMKGNSNAEFVKIDIKDANYLKLYAHNNGNADGDHSVYANAKLVKEGYDENVSVADFIKTVEEYDEAIKSHYGEEITGEYELLLLQREFVKNTDYELLQAYVQISEDNMNTVSWLMNDLENLRYYILGGTPTGGYISSLKQLTRLLKEYKSDFDITEPISEEGIRRLHNRRPNAPITKGDLYKRMAITLSLTHSAQVALWMQPSAVENQSDSVVRYRIYKEMYNQGKFRVTSAVDITPWFETYTIEEMRYVMNTLLDDESIVWLNEYTQAKIDKTPNNAWGLLTPHSYIAYVWPNYGNPIYYSEENRDYFNQLFSVNGKTLDDYGISRGTLNYRLNKLWMNFRNKFGTGCVCGGISKSGHCIRGVHGIASAVIGQPGHAALLYYTQDSNGKGYWGIDNDVSGWTLSEKGERLPLGWGNASYSRGYSVVYIALAQEAMNQQETLENCQKIIIEAKIYEGDPVKQEEVYRKALEVQPINIDAWYGLYSAYCANPEKTEDDFYYLAEEMAESLKYFPLPMYHLTNLIKPKMVSVENSYRFTLLQTRILNEAKVTPNNTADSYTVYQPSLTRLEANHILGSLDTSIASFSFDGNDANKIVLSSRFDGNGVRWDYCIDGNPQGGLEHWHEVAFDGSEEHKLLLTPEEIASITAENDIYIHIVGVNYSEENLYKIDIQESAGLPITLYANDLENRLVAATPAMQWKYNETDRWTSYSDETPDLTGNKAVIVRVGATGTYLASTNSRTYNFTEDNQPDTRKYIPVSHLSINAVSSEATAQGRHARNAIDANPNTNWHSAWDGSDRNKFIVIQLDEPKNLTSLEYIPLAGGNGKIESAQILTSMDGENWTEVVPGTDWRYANTNDVSIKSVDFEPTKAKYIKIVGKKTQAASASNSFMVAAMFNLYENKAVELVGTYSFDGENGGKIALLDEYKTLDWKYSLDSGATWKDGTGDVHQLTQAEMNQIDENNKIKIKFDGNETIYTINIKKGETPNIIAYLNDWENRLIGVTNPEIFEWKIEGEALWKSFSDEEPVVQGNKKLLVRAKATGIYTASDALEYQFNEDVNTQKETYIPISHLSIHAYSSQSIDSNRPFYAPNAIDGNRNTIWHTDFRYSIAGTRAFITIKLDSSKYISALEYVQKKYREDDPSYIRNAYIYVSENGEDWIEAGRLENAEQNEEFKKIVFDESISGQYVKIEAEGYGIFASLAMVNLYEDTTIKKVGSFSFDGEDANKIILVDEFKGSNWEYSLDGGATWKRGTSDNYTLTEAEVEQINGDNKIKIRINNVEYIINIQKSSRPTITAYLNDLENRLIGMEDTDGLEWKIETIQRTNDKWTDYSEQEPIVEGNAKLLIRKKAKNVFAASEVVEFQFTADNQEDTRKYIPVAQLSLASVSAEDKGQNGAAINAIDGNYNTRWLNSASGTDTQKYIIIKFDTAVYLSAMDYVPHSENGKILSGKIEGSMDGENFTDIATITGWANNQNTKTIDFDESVKVRYVKITGVETSYTSAKRHIGARMFNFYEDITKRDGVTPTAQIEYSNRELTNRDVVVRLVNPSTNITVLNNGGSTEYTFEQNGTFTFEFEDAEGNKGTATATVDWICKTLPEAIFEYDIPNPTNKDVTVTVKFKVNGEFNDNVTILNNDGSNTHTFEENGDFVFEFRGPYGNEGTATATVDWIYKTLPNATFTYDIQEPTNRPVTVTVEFDREGTVVTNNNGSNQHTFEENGTFTFEFRGPYGNEGMATASVDWIDSTTPTADITYNITEKTNQNVVATLDIGNKNLTITNNNGRNTHTFEENGSFTFEFEDALGNRGTAIATVNWIDKVIPNAIISYNISEPTNQEVIATINFDKQNVRITNNNGKNTYTFTDNGEFKFEYVDEAGNTGSRVAKVTWIDKTLPVATITYSTQDPTNQDVTATITFDKENVTVEGGNTHIFTENGEYEFVFVGPAGNKGVAKAKVTWIDKEVPEATIIYSAIAQTNQDIIATVVFENEKEGEVRITNNNGSNQYRFEENGTFTFDFTDRAGNTGRAIAIVNNIDKVAPTATVSYNITNKTNQNVVASLSDISEEITITNNDGNDTHTFTQNGTFIFEFVDKAGNAGTAEAKVTWIDRGSPEATIEYSTTELTNQDVTATITFNKENVTVDGGNTHIFTKNGEFTFEYTDEAGNDGMATAVVTWIDKEAPTATIEYDITEETTESVVASIKFNEENVTITNNNGNSTYTFEENGEFIFEFVDRAGNTGTAKAVVDWILDQSDEPSFEIDLVSSKNILNPGDEFEIDIRINKMKNIQNGLLAIMGQLEYNSQDLELLEITGKNGWNIDEDSFNEKNFKFVTENGKFITENGTVVTLRVKVNENINESKDIILKVKSVIGSDAQLDITAKEKSITLHVEKDIEAAKITSEVYTIREDIISRILPQTTVSEFRNNVTVNREITIMDENGDVLGDNDIIATGMMLEVGDEELAFTLIVIGDINRDGDMTLTDLALIKLHLVEKQILTGVDFIAADINNSGDVELTDLAQIKLILVGKKEIEQ